MRSFIRINAFLFISVIFLLAGGCKPSKLSVADDMMAKGEYFEAAKNYRGIYNRLNPSTERSLKGEVAYKMATCYRRINQNSKAATAYRNAARYSYPDSMLYYYLGRSLQAEGHYSRAIEAYDSFLNIFPGNRLATEGIRGCRKAIEAKNGKRTRYVVKEARIFNSRRADFSPIYLDRSLNTLYFTSSTEKATGKKISEITGTKNSDIFFSTKDEKGVWKRPEPAKGELNTEADEGIICFSPDGQTMYLTVAKENPSADSSVEIYTSRRSDASWSAPQRFEISSDSISAFGHPAISPDGRYLYFSSDMKGGYGGKDIWRIRLDSHRNIPENLGSSINTAGDEMFPFLRNDTTLYFSSDGHPGFGALDIFRADLNSTRDHWSVENMGIPMNSSGDDFGITFGNGEEGFISSNRNDAHGYDHIYSFVLPQIKVSISGMVLDRDEEPVKGAVIRIVGDDGSNQKAVAKDDGSFSFKLDRGVNYVMKAGAPGYLNLKQEFTSGMEEEDAEYEVDFILAAVNKPQVIENIFYDFDKATLRPESKTALDEVVAMMNDNPNVAIEMGAHTDRKGSDEYNIRLSDRRAKSVVDYLIAAGIKPDRLSWKGYGESVPKTITVKLNREFPQFPVGTVLDEKFVESLDPEQQEIADQINRRTEFRVTSITYEYY